MPISRKYFLEALGAMGLTAMFVSLKGFLHKTDHHLKSRKTGTSDKKTALLSRQFARNSEERTFY